jgi:hypothetical protein
MKKKSCSAINTIQAKKTPKQKTVKMKNNKISPQHLAITRSKIPPHTLPSSHFSIFFIHTLSHSHTLTFLSPSLTFV